MADTARFKILPSKMTKPEFVIVYGNVYEHSPHFAEGIFPEAETGKLDTLAELALSLRKIVNTSGKKAQHALICAHPDLADRLRTASLTQASASEQGGAGLNQCTADEFAEFNRLNTHYKEKFGFPFIKAVRGFSRGEILMEFRRRLANSPDREFCAALGEIHKIAYLRLADLAEQNSHD